MVAEALKADSFPVTKVEPRDGYLETPWFDSTGVVTHRRPLGLGVVRLRAWVDPSRPGHSYVTIETVYRELADPSLPERELDRELPADHPVRRRLLEALKRLGEEYGDPTQS